MDEGTPPPPPSVLSYATPERRRRREVSTMYFAAMRVLIYSTLGILMGWAASRETLRSAQAVFTGLGALLFWRVVAAARVFVRGYE